MLILAVDTSGKHGSIALARAETDRSFEVFEIAPLVGGTFSAQLVPQIAALLQKHGLAKRDIDGFAVASGPGSFTGLRVGLAAIKALAEILNKPIAAVSLLEAVAFASGKREKVVAALDAGRGQVYVGEYEMSGGIPKCLGERVLGSDDLQDVAGPLVTPDKIAVRAEVVPIERPNSAAVARIGWNKILSGETVSPEELEANYIRRSDAEIFCKP
jgi:tRNA threonylcarbamoyladenosine biosynthesis protein TsaB